MESLLIMVFVVVLLTSYARAAGNPLNHAWDFRRRRFINWLPLGLIYAFLYMGRYNLTVAKNALDEYGLMSNPDFGMIFGAGTITYAIAGLINGPITDRIGGKKAILFSAFGAGAMNAVMGVLAYLSLTRGSLGVSIVMLYAIAYSLNMYFQSFGAAAIVKVNANWFHIRERGAFGGMFGVLISLGIYFAFDWGKAIAEAAKVKSPESLTLIQRTLRGMISPEGGKTDQVWWLFFIPTAILAICGIVGWVLLRDKPSQAGFADIDPGDASSGEEEQEFQLSAVLKKIFTSKVLWVMGAIQFCSGILRNGVMHWYPIYCKQKPVPKDMLFNAHWGKVLCGAGISGGMLAGFISDKVFGSRRGPVAALLYGVTLIVCAVMIFSLDIDLLLGAMAALASVAIIGVHGMLAGTATMDFGGRAAAGTAVGVIDGFVYLGTGVQSFALGKITTWNWSYWPVFLIPFAVIGLVLAIGIWRAFPQPAKKPAGH